MKLQSLLIALKHLQDNNMEKVQYHDDGQCDNVELAEAPCSNGNLKYLVYQQHLTKLVNGTPLIKILCSLVNFAILCTNQIQYTYTVQGHQISE